MSDFNINHVKHWEKRILGGHLFMEKANIITSLRREMAQIIRLLEDSAVLGSNEAVYLYIGKLAKIQALLDELEETPMEWSNEDDY